MSLSPWFKSPFTDITAGTISNQYYGRCAKPEMKLLDCMEAYGLDRAYEKCDLLIDDFKECMGRQKQLKRMFAMRWERQRQYWAGERTKENLYAPPPKIDSY